MDLALLKKVTLFEGLTPQQLAKIDALLEERAVPAGQHVFREGEGGDEFYVVLSGKVRISKMVQGVGEEALAILEPGAYFGEMALVDDTPRSADALAHVSCTLGALKRDAFDQLMFMDK